MAVRHFHDLHLLDAGLLKKMLRKAAALKQARGKETNTTLAGKTLLMLFEKHSTRTRISFELAIRELGGNPLVLDASTSQLGRGETVADTARVLSRFVHAGMYRAYKHESLLELSKFASVPVINGLTDQSHPCQVMADMLTLEERWGGVKGKTLAWVGDGNNVASSLIHAAGQFEFQLKIACPKPLCPSDVALNFAKEKGFPVIMTENPMEAVKDADAIFTDSWVSMGAEDGEKRKALLQSFQVNSKLMAAAKNNALFLHCLPAHRGEEVTDEVMDSPSSAVWDEAENRLHAQKAILLWCMLGDAALD